MTSSMLLLVFSALFTRLEPAATALLDLVEVAPRQAPVATVQIDLVPDFDTAEQLAASVEARLHAAGLAHPVQLEAVLADPDMPVSYRVVIGPFVEFEAAERARTELEGLGLDGFVRELEPTIGC